MKRFVFYSTTRENWLRSYHSDEEALNDVNAENAKHDDLDFTIIAGNEVEVAFVEGKWKLKATSA